MFLMTWTSQLKVLMMATKKTDKQVSPTLCERCGTPLTKTEMRVFREGLYAIDPNGDKRKLCFKCKEKYGR